MDYMPVIKTSQTDWLDKALNIYINKIPFELIDDANIGLTDHDVSSAINLIKGANRQGAMTIKEIAAAIAGLGITAAGVYLVLAAIADPEPTTKLGLLIAGGLTMALTGSVGTLMALGITCNVSVKSGDNHFQINPQKVAQQA